MKLSELIQKLSAAKDKLKVDPEILIRKLPVDLGFSGSIVDVLQDNEKVKIIVSF